MPSKSGNSVIHTKRNGRSLTAGWPRSRRSWPSTLHVSCPLAGDDQHEIARIGRRSPPRSGAAARLGEELRDGRFQHASGPHAHPHEAGGPELSRPLDERVEPASRPLPAPGHADGPDARPP